MRDGPVAISRGRIAPPGRDGALERVWLRDVVALPGLVNAHDHLDFGAYPALARRAPYADYVSWAGDVTERRQRGELAALQAIPARRHLVTAALRNLGGGVTAVAHMSPLARRVFLDPAFPLRVLGEGRFHHSLAFGGALGPFLRRIGRRRFMIHLGEGTSARARRELDALEAAGGLRSGAVLVHGLALSSSGARRAAEAGAALVLCPSSNRTLYGELPDVRMLLDAKLSLALGSDSPVSGPGDLLADLALVRQAGVGRDASLALASPAGAAIFGETDLGRLEPGARADVVLADAADPYLERGRRSIAAVLVGGRPLLARRPGLLEKLGAEAREVAPGLFLERRLARFVAGAGVEPDAIAGARG